MKKLKSTNTANTLLGILIIFIIFNLAFYAIHLMTNGSQIEKKLITKDTAKIEHIQYEKNKTTYELSNGRKIINDIDKTNWNQNENKKHAIINKSRQQKLNKGNVITYKEEYINQHKKIFSDETLPRDGLAYTITKVKI